MGGGGTEVFRTGKQLLSTSGTRRVNLVTNPVINYEWGKDKQEVITTSGTYISVVICDIDIP